VRDAHLAAKGFLVLIVVAVAVAQADDGADVVIVSDAMEALERQLSAAVEHPFFDDVKVARHLFAIGEIAQRAADQDGDHQHDGQSANRRGHGRASLQTPRRAQRALGTQWRVAQCKRFARKGKADPVAVLTNPATICLFLHSRRR
jgi:hypothetical protein